MVYTCFLCKWRSDRHPRRSYHKFPSNTDLKQKWLDICGKSNVSVGERTSLCNVHFEENCFRYGLVMGRKILKDGSLPTLHLTRGCTTESIQPVDVKNPLESLPDGSLTIPHPTTDDLITEDPTTESHIGPTCVKDLPSQFETGNILLEVPVEFCPFNETSRKRTNTESMEEQSKVLSHEQEDVECRVCLQKYDNVVGLLNIFQPWETPWNGMSDSIAQDLSRIANIDITSTDQFPKLICQFCHQKLLEACSFVVNVRINDKLLRQRVETIHKQDRTWPEPKQGNQYINNDMFNTTINVELKQEAVSDDESYEKSAGDFKDSAEDAERNRFRNWEIKVEHEEIKQPQIHNLAFNNASVQTEFEQNSMLLSGDHKRPKTDPETGQLGSISEANPPVLVYQCCGGDIGQTGQGMPHIPAEIGMHQHPQTQLHCAVRRRRYQRRNRKVP